MCMAMGVAHVASLVDQDVIENSAIPFRHTLQLGHKVCEVLHMVPIHLGVVGNVLGLLFPRSPCCQRILRMKTTASS
jgi:hypothetical protein